MLTFKKKTLKARTILPDGKTAQRPVEIRTERTCRITCSRSAQREPGADALQKIRTLWRCASFLSGPGP